MSVLDDNIAKALAYLARFRDEGIRNQIGGEPISASSGETFQTTSPIDGALLAEVARSNADDVDAAAKAAKAAKAAFPAWRDTPPTKRRQVLHAIADGIVERAEEIAFAECLDTGQALRFMSKAARREFSVFR